MAHMGTHTLSDAGLTKALRAPRPASGGFPARADPAGPALTGRRARKISSAFSPITA